MNKYVNYIINQHNNAKINIESLETTCTSLKINNDKDKANFGNMCIALHAYRMIADATEAILINEDILKGDDGQFYQKLDIKEDNIDKEENA